MCVKHVERSSILTFSRHTVDVYTHNIKVACQWRSNGRYTLHTTRAHGPCSWAPVHTTRVHGLC